MSNYDKILREKEQSASLDTNQKEQHWQAMANLLYSSSPTVTAKAGTGKVISIIKWFFILSGLCLITYLAYKKFTKTKKEFNGVLKPSNIPSQFFTIDNTKDEVIRTSHASVLKFKKGTFKTDKPIIIEIKEVFTPAEILRSGLTTLSNDKPLKSAGMLYFNATVEGENIEPAIPVDAFVATRDRDKNMQLFKGELQTDSTVNWLAPQPITDTSRPKDFEERLATGRTLFNSKCASCHQVFKAGTGPALRGVQYRGPWKDPRNLLKWINNPPAFMATDSYTQKLKSQYGSMMTGFADLKQTDIQNLLTYLEYTHKDEPHETVAAIDSISKVSDTIQDCGSDTAYYSVQNNFEEYDTTGFVDFAAIPNDTISELNIFDYSEYEGIYKQGYDFQITNNGWYNIDAFLKTGREDVDDIGLAVEITNAENLPYNVYVFVPTERVLQSYTNKKGNLYSFNYENNKIPLPLRYRAVIFAFGSSGQRIMYSAEEFTIQRDQLIKLKLKETTKEGFINILYTNNINGVNVEAIEKQMEINKIPCGDSLIINSADIINSTK
jgi:mono/diheme cytochrome c family protein